MSIVKKHFIRYYTIIEVMVAMSIFVIMMTIMMQFFNSAQKVWNASSKRNMMYADARVAMNVMSREIQSMLYDNEVDTGTYPFWHQWMDIDDYYLGGVKRPVALKAYFLDNKDLPEQVGGTNDKNPYLTALNFIATTDLKGIDEGSDICEIRYKFIPVYYETASPTSVNDVKGGKLVRSCMEEYTSSNPLVSNTRYDFASYPYKSFNDPTARVDLFNTGTFNAVNNNFATIITGVYSLRFSCYTWGTGLLLLNPMSYGGRDPNDTLTSSYGYNLVTGTPAPVAIRIDMKLMDPKDLKKLAYNIYAAVNGSSSEKKDAKKQIKILKQKLRTFSKVIYLGKR